MLFSEAKRISVLTHPLSPGLGSLQAVGPAEVCNVQQVPQWLHGMHEVQKGSLEKGSVLASLGRRNVETLVSMEVLRQFSCVPHLGSAYMLGAAPSDRPAEYYRGRKLKLGQLQMLPSYCPRHSVGTLYKDAVVPVYSVLVSDGP
jgi:hypothetical protein